MEKVLRCECGFEAKAVDETELIAQVRDHALTAHGMRFSREEVLQLAARAEQDEASSHAAREDDS